MRQTRQKKKKTDKDMKSCLDLLVIIEIQVKTMKYHLIPIYFLPRNLDNVECWWGYGDGFQNKHVCIYTHKTPSHTADLVKPF